MKILYFFPTYSTDYSSGVNKKIQWQLSALNKNCDEVFYTKKYNNGFSIVNDKVPNNPNIYEYYSFNSIVCTSIKIAKFCQKNRVNIIYIRGTAPIFSIVVKIFCHKVKIVTEIPTVITPPNKICIAYLFFLLKKVKGIVLFVSLYRIVTFSHHRRLFGVRCIAANNGVSFNDIPVQNPCFCSTLNFISVANLSPVHGMDLFLNSLVKYNKDDVRVHLVGESPTINQLKEYVTSNNYLRAVVIFHGKKEGNDLYNIYNNSHIGLGCFALWRQGLSEVYALKCREYAAVGIPFIYAGSDPDFDGKYYVYQVPNKFDYINIDNVIAWYKKLPKDIRYDIRNDNIQRCSWDNIMKTIIDQL